MVKCMMLRKDDKIKLLILHSIQQAQIDRAVKLSYEALDAGIRAEDIAVALSENIIDTVSRMGAEGAVVRIGKYMFLLKKKYSREEHVKLVSLLKQLLENHQLAEISLQSV